MARNDVASQRILIIDEQMERGAHLSRWLRTFGCKTSVGFDAKAGVRLAQLFRPTLVFVSLGLPDRKAYWVLEEVKRMQGAKCALFVAIDASDSLTSEASRSETGFDWVVTPPIPPQTLHRLLDAAFAHREGTWERSLTGRRLATPSCDQR
jgi:DNA-binding response OmpR family regulator